LPVIGKRNRASQLRIARCAPGGKKEEKEPKPKGWWRKERKAKGERGEAGILKRLKVAAPTRTEGRRRSEKLLQELVVRSRDGEGSGCVGTGLTALRDGGGAGVPVSCKGGI